jgi:hypothetical protein
MDPDEISAVVQIALSPGGLSKVLPPFLLYLSLTPSLSLCGVGVI